jgi:hypothetical protein
MCSHCRKRGDCGNGNTAVAESDSKEEIFKGCCFDKFRDNNSLFEINQSKRENNILCSYILEEGFHEQTVYRTMDT